ncbi:hypothetical protein HQO27_01625 [Rhodococcus fascians]|nr:hypothetical protein [Rhodococcus fascians]MBY4240596.1 hypothetical protein [Rhodococcus fascians]MBY4253451.1 hypothetical protein [Rhodococcus fascians]MBY4269088.1 hypothetical protein [Rhodococcus fascians]MBY4274519.1 hypothetical protein [Rhodococcus fascians]
MTSIRIDTDRGALYGPSFAETLTHFFGQHQHVEWDCHELTAGYSAGRRAVSTAIRVHHRGQWIVAARSFGSQTVDTIPESAVRSGSDFATGPFHAPALPRWVYEWAQDLLS